MAQSLAQVAIDLFATRNAPTAFNHIDRQAVAATLRSRLDNPYGIYQGSAGLCGPAALSFEIAKSRPQEYVNVVIGLYENGTAKLGNWQLQPSAALRQAANPATIPAADWILLASIRDCENWFFDYTTDEYDDDKNHPYLTWFFSREKGGGTYASEMVSMMKNIGFTDVTSNEAKTNLFDKKPILLESLDFYRRDYQVLWLIHADILQGKAVEGRLAQANHFVAMAGDFAPPVVETAPVKVPIFTWGQNTTIPQNGTMPFKDFLSGFFGYVAGRL